jgi:predicted permease
MMPRFRRWRRRLRYWASHSERQRLLWEEMEFHVARMTDDLVEQGVSEREARAAAHRKFGNMTLQSEAARSTWIARWMSDAAQDLKYAMRGMKRDTGFTVFAILIAGLGIGASSTIFSVVNALLLRPLPFRDASQLVWISNAGTNREEWTTQVDHFLDLRAQNRSFSDLAGWFGFYGVGDTKLTGSGEAERLTTVPVTQNFFSLLGVEPAIGRGFTPEEAEATFGAPPAMVLSYGFWQRRFGSDPRVVGSKLTLNNAPVTVVGVLPESFDFAGVFAPGTSVDVFVPWPLTADTNRRGNTTKIIGRLKPGATARSAQAEFTLLAKQLSDQHPERNPIRSQIVPLEQHVSGPVRPALMVLACAVGVVMLIVCANLSNLQLARMGTRHKEMAMRAALGAGRARLLRQMLTESITLACCGAALGLALAIAGTRALAHLSAFNLPLLRTVTIDAKGLGFTLLAAVVTGVLFGLLPAIQVQGYALQDSLKDSSRGSSGSRRSAWVRSSLVVSEIAFACMLLVGAGLLIRSFLRVLDVNLGYQPERAAALRVDPGRRFANRDEKLGFINEVLRRSREVPGITAAGLTDVLPLDGDRSWGVSGVGQIYPKDHYPEAYIRVVSEGYFEAAGVPLRAGRSFTERDATPSDKVVIVNETLARTLWPGRNALGQMMSQDGGRRVIGVVGDVRHLAVEAAGGSEMYLPLRQTGDYAALQLVVRTTLPPSSLATAVRTALRPIDSNLPVSEFRTLEALVDKAVSPRRFLVMLLAGFAGFALLLASLGIYAVISYSVQQRSAEIGIRMALGASARELQGRILLHTLGLAALGLAVGMALSRLLADGLGSMLYGVTAGDPATFLGMGALLLAVAAVAGYVPARRASRIDPMAALRAN